MRRLRLFTKLPILWGFSSVGTTKREFCKQESEGLGRRRSSRRPCQPTQHNATHRPVDHRLRRLRQSLVVFAEPPRQTQPRERPFHHPSSRQDLEPAWLLLQPIAPKLPVSVVGYLDPPSSLLFSPLAETARVRPVGPNQLHPGQVVLQVSSANNRLPPSWSGRFAPWTRAAKTSPFVSTRMWRLRPAKRFAPSYPRSGPPTGVVFTTWLSITAALGFGSRPSASRTASRSRSCARLSRPSRRHLRKW